MAEESGQKKHEATPRKLEDLRRDGKWFSSKELNAAALIGGFAGFWSFAAAPLADRLLELARTAWDPARLGSAEPFHEMGKSFSYSASLAATILGVFLIALFCLAALSGFLQVGALFSVKPLLNIQKLNPATGFKNIFLRGHTYQRAAMGVIKAALMLFLVALTVRHAVENIILSSRIGLMATVRLFNSVWSGFLWQAALLLALFGMVDYLIEKRNFEKEQKMTDEELKKEQRDERGSPEFRAHRRGQQIRAAQNPGNRGRS